MTKEEDETIALPLVWIDPDSVEILFVNQMVVQRQGDEYILTFGQQSPPMLIGSPKDKMEQAEKVPYVAIRPAVRLGLTKQRMKDFVTVLTRFLASQSETEGRTDDS